MKTAHNQKTISVVLNIIIAISGVGIVLILINVLNNVFKTAGALGGAISDGANSVTGNSYQNEEIKYSEVLHHEDRGNLTLSFIKQWVFDVAEVVNGANFFYYPDIVNFWLKMNDSEKFAALYYHETNQPMGSGLFHKHLDDEYHSGMYTSTVNNMKQYEYFYLQNKQQILQQIGL